MGLEKICMTLYFTLLLYLALYLFTLCLLLKFPFKTEKGMKKPPKHVPLIEGHGISS